MKILKVLFVIVLSYISVKAQNNKTTIQATDTEVLVNVTVTDFKNKPREKDIVIFIGEKAKKIYSGITDSKGKFSLLLPKGETYNIKYRDFTDSTDYSQIKIPNSPGKFSSEVSIQIDAPKVYILENVLFDTGLASLKSSSYKALNELVEVMKLKQTLVIEIAGHTDNTGTSEINNKLSQDRANTVKNYLIKKGIAPERVSAKGYGDTEPIADNNTAEGKQKNRRTEVKILKE